MSDTPDNRLRLTTPSDRSSTSIELGIQSFPVGQ